MPGGPWHAQGHAVKALTDVRDTLDFARRDIAAYLPEHPDRGALAEEAAALEAGLVRLQRRIAAPVAVTFHVRKAPAAP